MQSLTDSLLAAIRKIIHSAELHSHQLCNTPVLSSPELMLLGAISENPASTIAELAKLADLRNSTTRTLLDHLEQDGLINCQRSVADQQSIKAWLSNKGESLLNSAPQALHADFIALFETLEVKERQSIVAAMQKVVDLMDKSAATNA